MPRSSIDRSGLPPARRRERRNTVALFAFGVLCLTIALAAHLTADGVDADTAAAEDESAAQLETDPTPGGPS